MLKFTTFRFYSVSRLLLLKSVQLIYIESSFFCLSLYSNLLISFIFSPLSWYCLLNSTSHLSLTIHTSNNIVISFCMNKYRILHIISITIQYHSFIHLSTYALTHTYLPQNVLNDFSNISSGDSLSQPAALHE